MMRLQRLKIICWQVIGSMWAMVIFFFFLFSFLRQTTGDVLTVSNNVTASTQIIKFTHEETQTARC